MKKTALLTLFFLLPMLLTATPQEDFMTALRESRLADAGVYLRNGGNINEAIENGRTALQIMCGEQRSSVVRWILDQGADPDLVGSDGRTPLMQAALIGSRDIAQILILRGAEINWQDSFGNTPLQIAVNSGHWELASYLEDKGGRILEGYFEHPVLSEIWTRRQHYKEALRLPEKRWEGYAFLYEVLQGNYRTVKSLLDGGVSPDTADTEGVSALMMAASLPDHYLSDLLLNRGADYKRRDSMGLDCLWYASFEGRADLVERLIESGVSLQGNFLENSPLFAAFAGGRHKVMETLLKAGADPRQSGRLGACLVHYAAFTGDMRTLRILDEHGADPDSSDGDGKKALDYLVLGFNLSENEGLYLEPARFLKEKKVGYTIDPYISGNDKLSKIIASNW